MVVLWWTQVIIVTTLCILRNIHVLLDACVDRRCNTILEVTGGGARPGDNLATVHHMYNSLSSSLCGRLSPFEASGIIDGILPQVV